MNLWKEIALQALLVNWLADLCYFNDATNKTASLLIHEFYITNY